MRHAELLADLAQIARGAGLVLHDARAADHFQIRDLREVGQDLVLHAVGEEDVLFVAAQIFKRKHRDAFLGHSARRERADGGGCCAFAQIEEPQPRSPRRAKRSAMTISNATAFASV